MTLAAAARPALSYTLAIRLLKAACLAVLVMALHGPVPALATQAEAAAPAGNKGAERFIDQMGQKGMGAIAITALSDEARKQVFRTILTQNFDLNTISRFVLGRYWRQATPAQQAEYQGLYQTMIINVYTARFKNYSGQRFEVTGSRNDASGDVVVSSKVVPANGGSEVLVDWRVRPKSGAFRVIDVMVEGVSMGVTQRNDFASVIQRGGGAIEALLAYLRRGGVSDVKS